MFKKSKDIRIKILEHFNQMRDDPGEVIANDWLSGQSKDLGIIRRALIELVDSEFISISNYDKDEAIAWLRSKMDTTTTSDPRTESDNNKKSSVRLIKQVGSYFKIEKIRIHTTIKGILFLQDYRKDKRSGMVKAFWILFSALIGFFAKIIFDWIN
jgi:hypothetical protein